MRTPLYDVLLHYFFFILRNAFSCRLSNFLYNTNYCQQFEFSDDLKYILWQDRFLRICSSYLVLICSESNKSLVLSFL